jgi:hypothetical protein
MSRAARARLAFGGVVATAVVISSLTFIATPHRTAVTAQGDGVPARRAISK